MLEPELEPDPEGAPDDEPLPDPLLDLEVGANPLNCPLHVL